MLCIRYIHPDGKKYNYPFEKKTRVDPIVEEPLKPILILPNEFTKPKTKKQIQLEKKLEDAEATLSELLAKAERKTSYMLENFSYDL